MPRKGEKPKHGANLGGHPGVKFGQGKLGLSALDELTGTRQADKVILSINKSMSMSISLGLKVKI